MQGKAFFLLAAVVFTSGCLEGLGFQGLFGSTETAIVAPPDVILVKETQVLPSGAIPADSLFEVNFQVQNTGGAETGKEARRVEVIGFDWGRCLATDPNTSQPYNPQPSTIKGIENQPVTIFPGGGTRLIEWEFKAPDNQKLGGVRGVCPIRFKVNYDFNAFTSTDLSVINTARLTEINRAGETVTVAAVQSRSEGPLKITIQTDAPQPVRTSTIVPMRISIEDVGEGIYNEVPAGQLKLTFPAEFSASGILCDERITEGGTVRTNTEPIQLIRKVSPPIRCDVAVPSDAQVTDLRTYNILAELNYTYTLFEQIDVQIRPTFERIESTTSGSPGSGSSGSGSSAPPGFGEGPG